MSANVIDSLIISLGLDPAEMRLGIQQIETHVKTAQDIVSQFAEGVDEGFNEGAAGAESLATAAAEAGNALREAGDKGSKGLDKVSGQARKASGQVRLLQNEAKNLGKSLGKSLGGNLKGFLAGLAAPMAGMLAAGAVVKGYFSDLGKLDELSRKTALSMEERASKQKLLAKYSKEDLERYRESNKALDSLGDTLSRAFAPVMSAVVPALTWLARGLEKATKFAEKHKSFVIPLIAAIAAIILATLVPALTAAAAAAWALMAPFLPFIAIAVLLALLIDSLWVYINGGKSALSDFFAIFGTGEEISEALAAAWEALKAIGLALWNALKAAALKFFSYFEGAIQPMVNMFKNALKMIKALFTGNFDEAIEHLENLLESIGEYIVAVFTGAFNLVYDVVMSIFEAIGEFFTGIFDSILGTVTRAIKGIISKIPDFLLPSSIIQWAKDVDNTVKETAASMQAVTAGDGAVTAADGVSPALAAGPIDNSTETTVNVGGVVVNAVSNDPAGIARETGNEMRRMTATGNKGVRQ